MFSSLAARLRRPHTLRSLFGVGLVLGAALALRLWGLDWGLPHAGRYYLYHPDETVLLILTCRVNPLWLQVTPGYYNYGTFYVLLSRLVYDVVAPMAGWGTVPPQLPMSLWVGDFAHLLWIGRCVSVALGCGMVLCALLLGRRLFGARVGWLAGGFTAVAPILVLLGHYMTVDVPCAALTTLALVLAAYALYDEEKPGRWIIGAAIAAGLATGTKYNAFPAVFPAVVPLWRIAKRGQGGHAVRLGMGAAIALIVSFLASTPGTFLDTKQFVAGVTYEMIRNQEGQGMVFMATPPSVLYHLGISFPVGLEWPLFLLCLAGLGWSVRQRRKEDVLLWLFIVPSFLLLAPAERRFIRYIVPLVPPLAVLAARLVSDLASRRSARLAWGIAAVAGGAALASTIAHLGVLTAPDARDQALAYLTSHSQPNEVVALATDAWFYTPPLHPSAGCVKMAQGGLYGGPPVWDLPLAQHQPRPDLCRVGDLQILAPRSYTDKGAFHSPEGALPVAQLEKYRPARVIISDYEYEDPERIRRANPSFHEDHLPLLDALKSNYHLEREFRPRPSLAGFTWWRRGIPPHDWRYSMPTIRIYRRNG